VKALRGDLEIVVKNPDVGDVVGRVATARAIPCPGVWFPGASKTSSRKPSRWADASSSDDPSVEPMSTATVTPGRSSRASRWASVPGSHSAA
jgi:hypothetical protein